MAFLSKSVYRAEYDGKPLSQEDLETLKTASKGNGVKVLFLTDDASIQNALQFILRANTAQIENPKFVKELKEWIRFNSNEATQKGDGLYGACVGSPSVPRWIGSHLFNFAFKARSENAKIIKQVQSSAGLAVFVSEKDDPQHWVEAGRCYERFALQATALGIKSAFLNQPVEEPLVRQDFADSLGVNHDSRLDFVVRFGRRACEMPRSFRRTLESVTEYSNCG
jgi:hypothetical protein